MLSDVESKKKDRDLQITKPRNPICNLKKLTESVNKNRIRLIVLFVVP